MSQDVITQRSDEGCRFRSWVMQQPVGCDDHLATLAAALTALEPDIRVLTTKVRAALDTALDSDLMGSGEFEHAWESTGAASLHDAVMELSELFYDSFEDFSPHP
jgi:hypothetical protein